MQLTKPLIVGSAAALLLGGILFEREFAVTPTVSSPTARTHSAQPSARPEPIGAAPVQLMGAAVPAEAVSDSPENSMRLRDEGYRHISALHASAEFLRAADFAIEGAPEFRRDWLNAAYLEWGKRQPEAAAAYALRLVDESARQIALQSVFSGWAYADPQGLAELALNCPEGPEKNSALTKAMRQWLNQDPGPAGDWIAAHEETIPLAEKMFRDDRR